MFWNQGYFDAHIEYPVRSRTDFALHLKISPGLGQRIKLRVQFLPMSGPSLIYELSGGAGRISLDPRWYEVGRVAHDHSAADGRSERKLRLTRSTIPP